MYKIAESEINNKTEMSFSSYFYNLDGNQTNFIQVAADIKAIGHDFPIIGLAVYLSKRASKFKESGIGLYINNKKN